MKEPSRQSATTHRNVGTGYAWAGQSNVARFVAAHSTNSIVFVGTLGPALFTGSTRKEVLISVTSLAAPGRLARDRAA